jgi:GNAT superfamily N-acetyltransferase
MSSPADARAFRELNEEWITRFFTLEEKDRITLGDPEGAIVAKGGLVLIARDAADPSAAPIGCVALIPMGDARFELSKMAVSPALRGKGLGRTLILHAIAEARRLGARSLFLGSSKKLANAVHLYESVGFTHVPPGRLPPMAYARADVFMEMDL